MAAETVLHTTFSPRGGWGIAEFRRAFQFGASSLRRSTFRAFPFRFSSFEDHVVSDEALLFGWSIKNDANDAGTPHSGDNIPLRTIFMSDKEKLTQQMMKYCRERK